MKQYAIITGHNDFGIPQFVDVEFFVEDVETLKVFLEVYNIPYEDILELQYVEKLEPPKLRTRTPKQQQRIIKRHEKHHRTVRAKPCVT